MNIDFTGKTVVVTGAGHGFGRAISLAFAGRGARLWACDLNAQGLSETKNLCKGACEVRTVDIADRAAVHDFIAAAADGRAVDILSTMPAACAVRSGGRWKRYRKMTGTASSMPM